MKYKNLNLILILLVVVVLEVQSQQSIPASGGNATGDSGTVSYSVGQIFYTISTSTIGSISHGVQQPYEISIITEIEYIDLECKIYPNPTTDNLIIKIPKYSNQDLSYYLYNMRGELLETKKIKNHETLILMNKYESSMYLISIKENHREIKAFRIIKN